MADALDNIFSAIMKSEMIAQAEIKKHKEAKDTIERLKLRIAKLENRREEHVAKKFQLEFAVADTNVAIKILQVKEEHTTNELKAIEEKVRTESNKLDEVGRNMIIEHDEFIGKVKTFSEDYSLTSSGTERRIQSAKECLKALEFDKDKLESEVEVAMKDNSRLRKILDEVAIEMATLEGINNDIDDIDKEIDNEEASTKELEDNISQLVIEPDCSPRFTKVKEEMQAYEVTTTELQDEIEILQTELKSLSRKLQNKEAQLLRFQYRRWQRQQNLNQKSGEYAQNETLSASSVNGRSDSSTDLFVEEKEDIIMISDEDIKEELFTS